MFFFTYSKPKKSAARTSRLCSFFSPPLACATLFSLSQAFAPAKASAADITVQIKLDLYADDVELRLIDSSSTGVGYKSAKEAPLLSNPFSSATLTQDPNKRITGGFSDNNYTNIYWTGLTNGATYTLKLYDTYGDGGTTFNFIKQGSSPLNFSVDGASYSTASFVTSGLINTVVFSTVAVPEPSTYALLAAMMAAPILIRKNRDQTARPRARGAKTHPAKPN